MKTLSFQVPETVFGALRKAPDEFVQEMRIAAAVKWYEQGDISQGQAAEIAGLTRADFINALSRYLKKTGSSVCSRDSAAYPGDERRHGK